MNKCLHKEKCILTSYITSTSRQVENTSRSTNVDENETERSLETKNVLAVTFNTSITEVAESTAPDPEDGDAEKKSNNNQSKDQEIAAVRNVGCSTARVYS